MTRQEKKKLSNVAGETKKFLKKIKYGEIMPDRAFNHLADIFDMLKRDWGFK